MIGGGLKIFTVHQRRKNAGEELPVFIREGFNLFAFLFGFLWALYHKLWLVSALILAAVIVIGELQRQGWLSDGAGAAVMFGLNVICGFHGNDWRRAKLKKRGFLTAGIVAAESQAGAELRFFEKYWGVRTVIAPA